MWLDGVHSAVTNTKHAIGRAWHEGSKVLGHIDRAATVGTKLFGVLAPFLGQQALSQGVRAIDDIQRVRSGVQRFDRDARGLASRLEAAVS